MIKGQTARAGVVLLDVAGAPVAGITPAVSIKQDDTAWKAATNAASVSDSDGRSTVLIDAAETAFDALQIYWKAPAAEFVPIFQTDPALLPIVSTAVELAKVIKSGEAADHLQNAVTSNTNVNVTQTRS